MSKKKVNVIFVFLLIGFSINFFWPKILSDNVFGYVRYPFFFFTIVLSLPYCFIKGSGIKTAIKILFFSQVISFLLAYLNWDQSLFDSFKSSILLMIWPFFFFLLHNKFPIIFIERIIIIYGIIYIILYFFQYLNSEIIYFGLQEEFKIERGVTRIIFPGGGVFYLTLFISLTRLTKNQNKKYYWIILFLVGLSVVVLQVTRQNIVVITFLVIYHFIKNTTFINRILVFISAALIIVIAIKSDNKIINGLIEAQNETVLEGNNYIRLISGEYFIKEFSPKPINRIFGNGVPYIGLHESSKFGEYVKDLRDSNGYYLSDVGFIGFYVMFGLLAVLAYIFIIFKCLSVKIPKDYFYIKYYSWFLLLTSLTSDYIFNLNYLVINILVFYMCQTFSEKNELLHID